MAEMKKVIIDLRGALLTLERKTGKKHTVRDVLNENNLSPNTAQNWDTEAPKAVKFIHDFIKETGLSFEELVKEVNY